METKKTPQPSNEFNPFWLYLIIGGILCFSLFFNQGLIQSTKTIDPNTFFEYLEKGDVDKIVVKQRENVDVYLTKEALSKPIHKSKDASFKMDEKSASYTFEIGDLKHFEEKFDLIKTQRNLTTKIDFKNQIDTLFKLFLDLFPILLMALLFYFFVFRRMGGAGGGGGAGQIFNIGKSRAKLFDQENKSQKTFKDVAGLEGAKEEIEEIVSFLKNPEKYTKLGGKIPKGALLVGPPGTGKTLLAKAVAGEAKVPFFSLSGSDFVEMFVGVGASRVRDLFKQAKEKSPSIIFIDEIDAIGRARGKNNMTGGNDERENTLNQLLTEMDGFGTDTTVIVMAATNRADVLDKALTRPGRFDRTIYVDLPDLNERKEIFEVHLKPLKLDQTVEIDFLARQTPGFSGADISNVCNEAALIAARKEKESIGKQDFLDAVDRIIGGLEKKKKIIKPHEKKRVAYHEAGHATVSWLLEHASPLIKVTIVPRGQSLGAAWYLPEERQITTPEQMHDEMCATLGGRAAEQVIFNNISTGALSDLEKVTKQATAMVTIYGLSEKIGNISYYDSSGQEYFNKPYSDETALVIDKEISSLIEGQYQRALKVLEENKDKLSLLAEKLLEKEVIFKEDLEQIFGKRPFEGSEIESEQ
ncbi:MAG: peptidase M41 [Flavobacteriaceae bacterium]|nr:MAG: peptidase M41 [Flavobacteriaceae bacterium]